MEQNPLARLISPGVFMLFLPLFALLSISLPQHKWSAEGLQEGESVSACALALPSEEVRFTRSRGFRVLDGLSGEPLTDVGVELWKEEDSRIRLADSGRTARDGTCLLDPLNDASKLVLRKDGYASEELGVGGESIVFLFPERPLIGRVLDFQGRPVVGARLATRQSCKHAPHAATARSDARGQFRMFEFPNGPNGASIEISAPGFVAESLEDESRWWTEIEATGEVLFFLARQPPLRARLLDENGENCVGVAFENYDRPLLFAVTNGSGELHFPSWPGRRRLDCTPVDGTHYNFPGVLLPVGLPVTLLPGVPPTPVAQNACLVMVEPTIHGAFYSGIAFEELDAPLVPNVTIFTHSGETYTGVGPHFLDSAGVEATLVAGHPFSGWQESVEVIALDGTSISPKIRIERETEIELILPENLLRARVEVDGSSTEIDKLRLEEGGLTIPHGTATFLAELENGEVRRIQVENPRGEPGSTEPMLLVNLAEKGEVVREAWWTDTVVRAEWSEEPDLTWVPVEILFDEALPAVTWVHAIDLDRRQGEHSVTIQALPGPLDLAFEFEDGSAVALSLEVRADEPRSITLR